MSGKAYTMREMKTIVEYLTEHKAYSETKGRKMWMDFAASKLTNRTWQSLKECFIKRILPDISNPYFKLDLEQIESFKRGLDLKEKDQNKLEFQPVNKESNHKDENGDVGQPSTSKTNNEANATGEDTTCSKVVHNRASTETLILDNCYETVEELQKELEKSTDDENDKVNRETKLQPTKSAAKSVRDFIVYSEPLTPMLQEVLDDFATDESDPQMEIDENYVNPDRRSNSPENVAQSQSILPHLEEGTAETTENKEKTENSKEVGEDHATENDPTNNDKGKQADNESASKTADTTISQLEEVMVLVDEVLAKHLESNEDSKNTENQNKTQSSNEASSVIPDTLLPNNQEAVNDTTFKADLPLRASDSNLKVTGKRKHSSSLEIIEAKKRHVDNDQTVSKTDGNNEDKHEKISIPIKLNNIEDNTKIGSPKKKHNLTLNNTNSNTETSRKTQALVEQRKPSINKEVDEVNADNEKNKNDLSSSQTDNPCLMSVSLYDEQFSSTKYSDVELNDDEDAPAPKPIPVVKKSENSKPKEDVILLKSRSNSESHDEPNVKEKTVDPSNMKLKKDKNLASIFGFVNGGSASKRLNGRKRTTSHRKQQHYESSESSEWTSASDSEYVSPPRGRRNRYARKYLKPQSARVRCLDEEGGLFVMLGNKIYPFVRDGKIIKNYVSYLPESDPEDEESYWKSKYVEEKKRTAELKKMVEQSKQNGIKSKESSIAITPPPNNQHVPTSRRESANGLVAAPRRDSESVEKHGQEKTVKIKFTKFDQEVQLEGLWQHLNPVLAQVVSMLKEPSVKPPEASNCVELSSGNTTPSVKNLPLDPGVQEKVNKIESDIFKEIKEMDEQEQKEIPNEKDETKKTEVEVNVTENDVDEFKVTVRKKLGRPKKTGTPILQSPVMTKEPTESTQPATRSTDVGTVKGQAIDDSTPNVAAARRSRTPRKLVDAPTVKSPRKKSPAKENLENEDEEVRYRFPSPPPEKRRRKTKNLSKDTKTSNNLKPKAPSPEALSHHSVNSSQGYQDSDASPFHITLRKKRRSISTLAYKGKKIHRKYRSKSYPLLKHISDSSNSSFNNSKTFTREQSTVNSEVYRSDSYHFLMPRTRAIMEKLKKIDETENEINLEDLTALRTATERRSDNLGTSKNDAASSSIVSLPSPELSMVESLTISKKALAIIGDYPSIEKSPNSSELDAFDKYLMSGVDVTMPLMGQECGLRESYRKHIMSALSGLTDDAPSPSGRNLPSFRSSAFKVSSISESILGKVSSANIDETADSLDKRLEELLLETVQKPKQPEKMEVDTQVKKKGSRKRCSTPNKKKAIRKPAKRPSQGILVEEECQTKCARNGRRSCPPSINIVYYENNAPDNLEINIHDQSVDVTTVTKRKSIKKDVIKVKILKPKDKPQYKKSPKRNFQNVSRTSGHTECDNESGVFLQGFDESADLIHNHSETCLQTKDCMGDSVEFLEMASKSIISVNSSDDSNGKVNVNVRAGTETPELFSDDAQCAVDFRDEIKSAGSGNTMFFTPLMSKNNSIMTEDLSDASPSSKPEKSRPSKWYLVTEEESNFCDIPEEANDVPSYGSNLNQIFPITCAIPDLSTITEMSDKNFNSCSSKLDGHFLDS